MPALQPIEKMVSALGSQLSRTETTSSMRYFCGLQICLWPLRRSGLQKMNEVKEGGIKGAEVLR